MQRSVTRGLRGVLCCALIGSVPSQALSIIQLKVLEREGITYTTGARATRGLTILVSDETGAPVENATVTFRLPDQGPSGVFNSGSRSQVVTTGPDGLATVWGMQWNKTPGPVEIQITAVKDQASAGIVATQNLNATIAPQAGPVQPGAPQAGGEGVFKASHKGHGKWLWIGAAVGGAFAAGIAVSHSSKRGQPTPAAVSAPTIGTPTIIVGQHP